jgi:alpha-beta hydrolase superfamily lysophospholipase
VKSFLRWWGRWLIVILAIAAALWVVSPHEPVNLVSTFNASAVDADPSAYLARREAVFGDITPGAEKRIVWANGPGVRSGTVLVYVHGFSATSEEIRPVPDLIATALGANLIYTRLAGHGRDGPALAAASVADWVLDLDEALAIADQIGDRIVLVTASTGSTLAAAALTAGRDDRVAGLVMISPNFRIKNPLSAVLTFPAARIWVPLAFGSERAFEPANERHARWWTTRYPSSALFPMAALVKAARSLDFSGLTTPALFLFAETDQVVDHIETRKIADRWGGPVTIVNVTPGDGDDPFHHVIAGDILSPGQNAFVAKSIEDWVRGL